MWRDIGLDDWLFDIDHPEDFENYVPTVLEIAKNPQASRQKAAKAHANARESEKRMVEVLKQTLNL